MDELCSRIVNAAGAGLEAEDQFLLSAWRASAHASKDPVCGILRDGLNEHAYQYVIARSLTRSLPFRVRMEGYNRTDIVLLEQSSDEIVALVEIKALWTDVITAQTALPGIDKDVKKLASGNKGKYGLMMILSNCSGDPPADIAPLMTKYGHEDEQPVFYSFGTFDVNGNKTNFWVAVIQIRP